MCCLVVCQVQEYFYQVFDFGLVFGVEVFYVWVVQIEYSDQVVVFEQGYYQFVVGSVVVGDVVGKCVDVVDLLGQLGMCCGVVDVFGEGDVDVGDFVLEWFQDQFFVVVQIEVGLVQVVQFMEEKGGELCGVGDEIVFVGEQCFGLCCQQGVVGQFGVRLLQIDYVWCFSSCLFIQQWEN